VPGAKLDLNPPHGHRAEIFDLCAPLIASSAERWSRSERGGFLPVAHFDFVKSDNEATAVARSTVAAW